MSNNEKKIINDIQNFNHFYTGVLELLNNYIPVSDYSQTETRILHEIGHSRNCIANDLVAKLGIDRGYVSRIIKKFESRGLLSKKKSTRDARSYLLFLTPEGQTLLTELEKSLQKPIQKLIKNLEPEEKNNLISAMKLIERILFMPTQNIAIKSFVENDIKTIIERHVTLYHDECGLDDTFREYVTDAFD